PRPARTLTVPASTSLQGIWRIPVDEIDRPGSFASHMNRSIVLLLQVLSQLKDYGTLLRVSSMLQRTPDQGKKYLRDADRQVLAQRAFVLTVKVLEETLTELTEGSEGRRMTTDISSKPGAEDGGEALPKKPALSDGAAAPGHGPPPADPAEPGAPKERPRPLPDCQAGPLGSQRSWLVLRGPGGENGAEDSSAGGYKRRPDKPGVLECPKGPGHVGPAGSRGEAAPRGATPAPPASHSLDLSEAVARSAHDLFLLSLSSCPQATGDTPTTPKPPKDGRESFFWASTAASPALQPASSNPDTAPPDVLPRPSDALPKAKPASASKDPEALPSGACPAPGEEPAAGGHSGSQQPETQLGPQADAVAMNHPELGPAEPGTGPGTARACSQASSSKASGSPAPRAEPPRVKARLLPSMPKLVIPSAMAKFPPEITVTPPTPTLLSPKGSISEETKQKLKSAILSAQSAATVKKESLCQPALEILEMSSQESSLESESDEDDDYMDI
ncbi:calcineurin-binding protein cabin-1-like, partial [Gracilinanus agilis]|uniref:calcineurin-binding protein cabin-1-like n=1 Tax=Gracilinanus agilis TaxID=191870 RepID=UPI001CFD41F9